MPTKEQPKAGVETHVLPDNAFPNLRPSLQKTNQSHFGSSKLQESSSAVDAGPALKSISGLGPASRIGGVGNSIGSVASSKPALINLKN